MDWPSERRAQELHQALAFVHSLPSVAPKDIPEDDNCPICFVPFSNILEEENATKERREGIVTFVEVMPGAFEEHSGNDDPDQEAETHCTGVVKLTGCGHMFCRRDLSEWVASVHGSCPACRNVFFDFSQESEYESSDGGEYIPGESEGDDVDFTDDGDWMPSSDRDTVHWDLVESDDDRTEAENMDTHNDDIESIDEGGINGIMSLWDHRRQELANLLIPYLSDNLDRPDLGSDNEDSYHSEDFGTVTSSGRSYSSGSTDVGLSDGSDTFASEASYEEPIDEDERDAVLDVNMLSMDELNNEDDPDYDPLEDDLMSDDTKTYYSGYSSGAEAEDEGSEP